MSAKVYYRVQRGAWYVNVYEDGKQVARCCGKGDEGKARAEELAAELNAEAEAREKWESGPVAGKLGVASAVRHYLAVHAQLLGDRTQETQRGLGAHLIQHFGERPLGLLNETDLAEFVVALRKTETARSVLARERAKAKGEAPPKPEYLGAASAVNCLSLLRRIANIACRDGGPLREHRLGDVDALIKQAKRSAPPADDARNAWSHEEAGHLLAIAKRRARYFFGPLLCAFSTGARVSEILGLRWCSVDLVRGEIHWREQQGKGGERRRPKWGEDRRAPISPALAAHLRELAAKRPVGASADDLVFLSPRGKRLSRRNVARTWERVRDLAHRQHGVRPFVFHSTRHSFVSWALEAGRPVPWVSEVVGADPRVIFTNYAHVLPRPNEDLSFCAVA